MTDIGNQAAPWMDIEEFTLAARGMVFSGLACGPKEGETVLLLHGFPQFADSWAEVAVALAKAGYRAIAIDQRGYSAGARPETVRDYAVDDLVADVLAIAIALGLERFHLAGHDWGGIVAWSLAARYPDRLQSLSIVSTPHVDALLEARRTDRDQKRRSRYITVFRLPFHVAEWLLLRRGASALKRVFKDKLPKPRLDDYVSRLSQPGVLTAGLSWYRALDLHIRIGRINVPTVFIWGSNDQALGRAAAEATSAHVNASYRFVELQRGSHWLLEESPEVVAEALIDHLKANAPSNVKFSPQISSDM